jgi:hypothetical protein
LELAFAETIARVEIGLLFANAVLAGGVGLLYIL